MTQKGLYTARRVASGQLGARSKNKTKTFSVTSEPLARFRAHYFTGGYDERRSLENARVSRHYRCPHGYRTDCHCCCLGRDPWWRWLRCWPWLPSSVAGRWHASLVRRPPSVGPDGVREQQRREIERERERERVRERENHRRDASECQYSVSE